MGFHGTFFGLTCVIRTCREWYTVSPLQPKHINGLQLASIINISTGINMPGLS